MEKDFPVGREEVLTNNCKRTRPVLERNSCSNVKKTQFVAVSRN